MQNLENKVFIKEGYLNVMEMVLADAMMRHNTIATGSRDPFNSPQPVTITNSNNAIKKRYFFLFRDVLLMCKPLKTKSRDDDNPNPVPNLRSFLQETSLENDDRY